MGSPAADPSEMIISSSKIDNCLTPLLPATLNPRNMSKNIITERKAISSKKFASSSPKSNSSQSIINQFLTVY